MLNDDNPIRPMGDREFKMVPVDAIIVPNPRKRCEEQFKENLRSIKELGLRKPITVNKRNFPKTGKYALVCGQGRWEIHKMLGESHIFAEVIDEDEGKAFILSLVENIARSRPRPIEFAKAIVKMYDSGVDIEELARITGRSRTNLREYIALMKKGERRLINGVEKGIFPITFAKQIARENDIAPQSVLMDAFEEGIITEANLQPVRKILEARKVAPVEKPLESLEELTETIQETTEQLRLDCNQVKKKQNRLFRLLILLREIKKDKEVIRLADEEGVSLALKLKKDYYSIM